MFLLNEEKSSVTMPSDVLCQFMSYVCLCVLYSDVLYVYLCTDAAVRIGNMLYICKFER